MQATNLSTPVTQSLIADPPLSNDEVSQTEQKQETFPAIINVLSVIFYFKALTIFPALLGAIGVPHALNSGMTRGNEYLVEYASLKFLLPFYGIVGITHCITFILYIYLGMKIRDQSRKSWNIAMISVCILIVIELGVSFLGSYLSGSLSTTTVGTP